VKAGEAAYNSKRLGSKRAFANALVILSPSPPVILSKAKNLETLPFHFVQGQGDKKHYRTKPANIRA